MADVERFVDTAASAGGDGTTRNHTGGTRAYASLSAWESAEQTNLDSANQTHRVRCAGSTADTTAVIIGGWTTSAADFITIQGDDAAPDNDGFYGGDLVWSTGHFRLSNSAAFDTLELVEAFTVIDGIQIENTRNNISAFCIEVKKLSIIIKNCRITKAGVNASGIFGTTSINDYTAFNNIVFDCPTTGISAGGAVSVTQECFIYNNTVFDCGDGIKNTRDDSLITQNWFNNDLFNNGTDEDISESNSTVNHDWNAGQDAPPTDETNGVTIGTLADAMVDPENATEKSINVQVKDSSSTLFKASDLTNADDSKVPTVDIVGNTRNTAAGESTSIGAWANINEAAPTAFDTFAKRLCMMNFGE